jgi:hypothetical protein
MKAPGVWCRVPVSVAVLVLKGSTMKKYEGSSTRYFIDLDLKQQRILNWDYGDKNFLSQELSDPDLHRVFISRGQYNKLCGKSSGMRQSK